MPSYNAYTIYWDVSPDCVTSVAGFGLLLSGSPPVGDGEAFFSVAAVSTLAGKFLMLGLFCGLRKLWAWANNPCLSLACWALNADPVFELFSCGGGGGAGVLPWGRGGRGLLGICPPGRCIGFGKLPWLGGTFGRKLAVFINICGRTTEAEKLDDSTKIKSLVPYNPALTILSGNVFNKNLPPDCMCWP